METLNFKPSKKGFILNNHGEIEQITYKDYLREFGSDETTTPNGVAPRLYVDGKTVYTWGVRGNNHAIYRQFGTKKEAKNFLLKCWEWYIDEKNWDAPQFFTTKSDLYEDLSESYDKAKKVIKRYFKIQQAEAEKLRLSKIKHDNRPSFTKSMMIDYIKNNLEAVKHALNEMDELKQAENKEVWQVKANALIQKVSNNDFRILKWKDIYILVRETVK